MNTWQGTILMIFIFAKTPHRGDELGQDPKEKRATMMLFSLLYKLHWAQLDRTMLSLNWKRSKRRRRRKRERDRHEEKRQTNCGRTSRMRELVAKNQCYAKPYKLLAIIPRDLVKKKESAMHTRGVEMAHLHTSPTKWLWFNDWMKGILESVWQLLH